MTARHAGATLGSVPSGGQRRRNPLARSSAAPPRRARVTAAGLDIGGSSLCAQRAGSRRWSQVRSPRGIGAGGRARR